MTTLQQTAPAAEVSAKFELSAKLQKQYQDEGYIVVPKVLSEEHIERLKARARQFALGDLPAGAEKMVVQDVRVAKGLYKPEDPEKGLWKFLHPDRHDPLFRDYAATPKLLDVLEGLIGPDIKSFLTMFIYKPPGVDAVHDYHQDGYYFPFGPHDLVLGTWIPLDHADADNGTLSVIPGSHKLGIMKHELPAGTEINAGIFGVQGYVGHPTEVTLDLQPGDGVFFHSRMLHATGPNKTERHRRVLTVHYASSKCQYTSEKKYGYEFRLMRGQSYEGCV